MRACIYPGPRGVKAKLSAALLGIGEETLRYWRDHLDPSPELTYFSAGRLLAYRVLAVLIRRHFVPVATLQRCDCGALFECCEHVAFSVLERSFLYLDPEAGELSLHEVRPVVADDNLDAQMIPLRAVVAAHRDAWERLGTDSGTLRQRLKPTPSLAVVTHRH